MTRQPVPRSEIPVRQKSELTIFGRFLKWIAIGAVAFVMGMALSKCGQTSASTTTGVPWGDYSSNLQGSIVAARDAKDCVGLQTMFNDADANNAVTMTRAGHNNADLMTYIDWAMKSAGCH
jgi:hypothetical protein